MPALRGTNSKRKTRRRQRDLDQVHSDLRSSRHLAQYKDTKAPEDLPALGQWYCVECAKWFEAERNLVHHRKGKVHKRRIKLLKDEPHSQKAAEAAVGLSTDNGRHREEMQIDEDDDDAPDTSKAAAAAAIIPGEADYNDEEEYNAFFSAL